MHDTDADPVDWDKVHDGEAADDDWQHWSEVTSNVDPSSNPN